MSPRTVAAGLLALYILAAAIEPADGGELYASGGLALQAKHGPCMMANGKPGQWCKWDRSQPQPLLGHVELGYSVGAGRWSAALYVRHESQPTRNDYGVNSVGITTRVTIWKN